ncbi:DNA-directed RNA polymerase subunit alpha [Candidatus Falkowbacteria bacterium]|nr:DNA-directed RNA polymerase subunit alpha [Candidatus Falkowbacteria bacterium]
MDNNIAKPNKIEFKKGKKDNEGLVVIEPFYPGYGMTVGNSLRRVLLSSLLGTAVVAVKIKEAAHEFSSLPHVKEDVLEIILNLKNLKIKMFEDEEVRLELDVHGKKEVKASDIKKDSKIEIVNPDLTIANITDMAGSLSMEILIGKGRGYRPVESIKEKKGEIGMIDMDAVFSPVLAVGLDVDNVRVGDMTNWDKLSLNIETDGTISPEEAFKNAVSIMKEQFGALDGEKTEEAKDDKKEEEEEKEEDASEADEKKEEKKEEKE